MSKLLAVIFFLVCQTAYSQTDTLLLPVETKSPGGAMLRSAVLPGWGQVYNESYIKAPLLLGTFATFGGIAWWYHDKYSDYREKTRLAFASADGELDGFSANLLRQYREFYRDERDRYIFYVFLTYLLNIADAYVDAHLYGFDVDGSLSVLPPEPSPVMAGRFAASPTVHVQLKLTF